MLRQGQRFYGEEDPSTSYQRRPVVAWELGQCYNTCYLCRGINATKAGRWPSKRGRQESGVVTLEQLYIPNIWSPRCCREREGREQEPQFRSKSRQMPYRHLSTAYAADLSQGWWSAEPQTRPNFSTTQPESSRVELFVLEMYFQHGQLCMPRTSDTSASSS